jgi:hypothetical protein
MGPLYIKLRVNEEGGSQSETRERIPSGSPRPRSRRRRSPVPGGSGPARPAWPALSAGDRRCNPGSPGHLASVFPPKESFIRFASALSVDPALVCTIHARLAIPGPWSRAPPGGARASVISGWIPGPEFHFHKPSHKTSLCKSQTRPFDPGLSLERLRFEF